MVCRAIGFDAMLHTPLQGKPPCDAVHRSPWKRHEHKRRVSARHPVDQTVIYGAVSAVTGSATGQGAAKPPLTVPSLRASCPALAHVDDTALRNSMRTLQDLYLPHQVARLVSLRPEVGLVTMPVACMCTPAITDHRFESKHRHEACGECRHGHVTDEFESHNDMQFIATHARRAWHDYNQFSAS